MNASPAPVVSISSSGGIFSAVAKSDLPCTVPITCFSNRTKHCKEIRQKPAINYQTENRIITNPELKH